MREYDRDYPDLKPKLADMVRVLSDLQPHAVEDIRETVAFNGFKRNTIHEVIRLLRDKGYRIISPEKKMTRPYTFQLLSLTPDGPVLPERCPLCNHIIRKKKPEFVDDSDFV